MTDNEIIMALECCKNNNSVDCPLLNYSESPTDCMQELINCAIDLINRQKAEIERLKDFAIAKCKDCAGCTSWKCDCANIEAEAIKEFAERLKQVFYNDEYILIRSIIDNLVKEMVGDNDDK